MAVEVYVALGSNLGDREAHLDLACTELNKLCVDEHVLRVSSRIETLALVPAERIEEEQPNYLNAVAHLYTALEPLALLDALQAIEATRGRQRSGVPRWSARTLDLDLLIYGEQRINTQRLSVPHPLMTQREFVLQPLAEIAPSLEIPGTGMTASVALERLRVEVARQACHMGGDGS